jgi:hypothetical protein
VRFGIDLAGLEPGEHAHHLERRARRVGALGGAVQQRECAVGVELLPAVEGDAARELVGVELGLGDHGEHAAVARVQHHRGAAIDLGHRHLERALDGEVERERDVTSRHRQPGRSFLERGHALAHGVHDHELGAVDAAQHVLVAALHAGLADQVAEPVALVGALLQLAVVDLDVDAGEVRARLLDRRHHRVRRGAAQHRGLPGAVRLLHLAPDVGRVADDGAGDAPQPHRVDGGAHAQRALDRGRPEHDVEARLVVGEDAPGAVADRAPRRADDVEADAVLLREPGQLVVLQDLEAQQAQHDHAEARDREPGEECEPAVLIPLWKSLGHVRIRRGVAAAASRATAVRRWARW